VEQPVFCSAGELVELAQRCEVPLMADESLLTDDDAAALLEEPSKVWWNIRLCKNGGLVRSLRLAHLAVENGVSFVAGCMVGESSILSAAQRRFLQLAPAPRFVEGNYGRLLLSADLTTRSLHFGYAGKLEALRRPALGVVVDPVKVFRYSSLVKVLEA
jgi:L-alanine-DL-glutamate epimerase-like enolase superfamily enzyme